ncbi:MAG: Spy/CpxP family protein refolding chaperone [Chlamydiae bacterium]|nr:Spy/CpxP family protein refolding chaperone [Chlamydiota bacterium]MBI3267326.1 Spy/CpxP family protein refolding chaperone [Chlamydiota bacterium]
MKKGMIYAGVAVAILAGGLGLSHLKAQGPPLKEIRAAFQEEGPVGLKLLMDISDLNMTADQKVAIRSILKNHWAEAKPLLQKMNESRLELREVIRNTPHDEKAIRDGVYRRAQTAADLAVLRGKVSVEVRSILTPEQEKKIEAIFHRLDHRLENLPDQVEEFLKSE